MSIIKQDYGSLGNDVQTQMLIAPVLAEMVSDRAYAVGEQFIVNNVLYKITQAVSAADVPLVVGSNCEVSDSITQQMKPEIITLTDYDPTKMNIEYQNCWKCGHIVHIMVRVKVKVAIASNIFISARLPKPKLSSGSNYYYGWGMLIRDTTRLAEILNGVVSGSSGFLYWNGGAVQVNDILQIQFDYCTDE